MSFEKTKSQMSNKFSLTMVDPVAYSSLLNSAASEVSVDEIKSPEIQSLIDAMIELANGKGHDDKDTRQVVGLAAPQVGLDKRIILIDLTATGGNQNQRLTTIINPVITSMSDEKVDGREGCWSCGDVCGNVSRAEKVTLSGLDRTGEPIKYNLDGFVARIAQHEVDHLNGVRFPDRIPETELWRLHYVKPDEFEDYRTQWADWPKLYSRADWLRLRDGISRVKIRPVIEKIASGGLQKVADEMEMDPLYVEKVRLEIASGKLLFFAANLGGNYVASNGLCIGEADESAFRDNFPDLAVPYSLFVKPDSRGKGIGTMLMDTVESYARKMGKKGLALGVVRGNVVARKMYEKRGYEYCNIGEKDTIQSHWDITDSDGKPKHVIVDLLPMVKHF